MMRLQQHNYSRDLRPQRSRVAILHADKYSDKLDELVAYMKAKPGVWFATCEQIARYVKDTAGLGASPR